MAVDPRLLFDIFSALVLLAVAVLGSWLPLYLSKGGSKAHGAQQYNSAYHIGNCLSAGVMLSAGFCHLLADSLHGLSFVGRFPMANFLAALGFLVTLAADQVVHSISHGPASPASTRHSDADLEMANGVGSHTAGDVRRRREAEKVPLLDDTGGDAANGTAADEGDGNAHNGSAAANGFTDPVSGVNATVQLNGQKGSSGGRKSAELVSHGSHGGAEAEDSGGHFDVLLNAPKLHFATAVLLAVALCVHSVLEGMALGAQQSMRSTQDIMLAIAAHKGLAAYALGSSVVESGADLKKFWTVALSFSLATPVAIFIGYGLSTVSSGHGGQALSALASGTFLYVAMMEVIPRELSGAAGSAGPRWMRLAKLAALLIGFGAMSLLAIWA